MWSQIDSVFGNQHIQDGIAGAGAGTTTMLVLQPIYNKKIDKQMGIKTGWRPKTLWAGAASMAAGDAAVFCCQGGILSGSQHLFSPLTAGLVSAIPATVTEVIQMKHRTLKDEWKSGPAPTYASTMRAILRAAGPRGFFVGYGYTAAREGIVGYAWKPGTDYLTTKVEKHLPNHTAANILSGVAAGIVAGLISHPFDTRRVEAQSGTLRPLATRFLIRTLMQGSRERVLMLALSVPIASISSAIYANALQKLTQKGKKP